MSLKESSTSGITGLGNDSGTPAMKGNSYASVNAMSYEDENGNRLEWMKKHAKGHNAVGFDEFNPKETKKHKHRIDEVKLPKVPHRVKKAVATGMTAANIATLGMGGAEVGEGRGKPSDTMLSMATTVPGPAGYAATVADYGRKIYNHMTQQNEDCWKGYKAVGVKKKGKRTVPNCVPVEEENLQELKDDTLRDYVYKASQNLYQHGYSNAQGNDKRRNLESNPQFDAKGSKGGYVRKMHKNVMADLTKSHRKVTNRNKGIATALSKIGKPRPNLEEGIWGKKIGKKAGKEGADSYLKSDSFEKYVRGRINAEIDRLEKDPKYKGHFERLKAKHMQKEEHIEEGNKLNKLKKRDWQDPKKRPQSDEKWDPRDTLSGVRRGRKVAEEHTIEESFIIKNKKSKVTIATYDSYEQAKQKLEKMANKKEFSIYKTRHKGALHNRTINEANPRTLGAYIHSARKERSKALEGPKPDIKKWSKRHEGIKLATKKLLGQAKVDPVDTDEPPFKGGHKRKHRKLSTRAHNLALKGMKMQKEDTNDLINEALDNILENNLVEMKENFLTVLQEKAMERLEEKKKEIASNYFAQ